MNVHWKDLLAGAGALIAAGFIFANGRKHQRGIENSSRALDIELDLREQRMREYMRSKGVPEDEIKSALKDIRTGGRWYD